MIDFTTLKNLATKFTVTGAQKAHIDRLVFELGIQEKEAVKTIEKSSLLESENAVLKERVTALESEVLDLRSKLAAIDENKEIDDQAYQILDALFDERDGMSTRDVARRFQISEGVAEFHFDCLDGLGFVQKSPPYYGMGDPIPVSADISSKGRAYVMAARKRV